MSIVNNAKAVILAASIVATPVLAAAPGADAGQQVQILLNHAPALRADLLKVRVEGEIVYVRGTVDSQLESSEIDALIDTVPGARIINDTVVTDTGS